MKRCTKCNIEKSDDEFNWKKQGVRRHSICKACHKIARDKHYQDNRRHAIHRAGVNKKKRSLIIQKFLIEYLKLNPCVDCGEGDPVVLDFDHVRGVKEFEISAKVFDTVSFEKLKHEIAKCQVRCANCHRRRHAAENGSWRYVILKGD